MFGPIQYLSQPVVRHTAAAALFAVATVPFAPSASAATTLGVSGAANYYAPSAHNPSGGAIFAITIANTQTFPQVCAHISNCYSEPTGPTATGVTVDNTIGWGAAVSSVTADSGFNCVVSNGAEPATPTSGSRVTCSNGSIAAGGTGHITITVHLAKPLTCSPVDMSFTSAGNNNAVEDDLNVSVPGLSTCQLVN
jgi:hypothetical protein